MARRCMFGDGQARTWSRPGVRAHPSHVERRSLAGTVAGPRSGVGGALPSGLPESAVLSRHPRGVLALSRATRGRFLQAARW